MNVYRVLLTVIDFDELGADGVRETLECTRFENGCIRPSVQSTETRDIGEWSDDHPLNHSETQADELSRLFDDGEECWCLRCARERGDKPSASIGLRFDSGPMIVCSTCGNKRCPRAADHRNACTNSNAPGQAGSEYWDTDLRKMMEPR